MGNKCCGTSGVPSRYELDFSTLRFGDLVLIRSKVQCNGFELDARTAAGVFLNETPFEHGFDKWDRVGLIQLPTMVDPLDFSAENIKVTEATHEKVCSRTLAEVLDGAKEVVIRSLFLSGDDPDKDPNEVDDLFDDEDEKHVSAPSKPSKSSKKKNLSHMFPLPACPDDAGSKYIDGQYHLRPDLFKDDDEQQERRMRCMQKFFAFCSRVVGRQYKQRMSNFEHLFSWINKNMKKCELSQTEIDLFKERVNEFDRTGDGIQFEDLDAVFRAIIELNPVYNAFSNEEIFDLVSMFPYDLADKSGKRGPLDVAMFVQKWEEAMEKVIKARKLTLWRSLLSGGFVSLVYQKLGILPPSDTFFQPHAFASRSLIAVKGKVKTNKEDGKAVKDFKGAFLGPEMIISGRY